MSDTAKAYPIGKAPKRIDLLGDKTRRPESAQHIITFPGGAIELSRTTDGDYWAHVIINTDQQSDMEDNFHSARGEVIASRVDFGLDDVRATGVRALAVPDGCSLAGVRQIAVLIKATRPAEVRIVVPAKAGEPAPSLFDLDVEAA